MRERLIPYASVQGKAHLCRLPDLDEPLQSYPGESKRAIILMPLFLRDRFADNKTLEVRHLFDFTVRSGLWAIRSWQKFSDVIDHDIQMAFHVHAEARSLILPILRDNGIPDKDIFYQSDAEFRDPNGRLWYPLKIAALTDPRFRDYDYVICCDTDMFIGSPNGEKLDFFDRLFDFSSNDYGALHVFENYYSLDADVWLMKMSECYEGDEAKKTEWLRRAAEILDSDEKLDVFRTTEPPRRIGLNGCFHVFPAKYFHRFKPDDVKLLREAARLMQCDEPSVSVWHIQTGNPVYSLIDELGIRKITSLRDVTDPTLTEPYMCHPGHFRYEPEWRDDLGIPKYEELL